MLRKIHAFLCSIFVFLTAVSLRAEPIAVSLTDFASEIVDVGDDTPALIACFKAVAGAGGGTITIPPGNYSYAGKESVPICSNTTVFAYGARFHLPKQLGEKGRLRMFVGENISRFQWFGGEFYGNCFDAERRENDWEPSVDTQMIRITTTPDGTTGDLLFRDIRSDGVAGAVVFVTGAADPKDESKTLNFARRISVKDCVLLRTGPFMWDYGYLWQQIVWPEDYEPWEVERAYRYFRNELIRENVSLQNGDDAVRFENKEKPVSKTLCFFGDVLPKNLVRGKRYFVVASSEDHVKIADTPDGEPIRFDGDSGPATKLIHNVDQAFYHLFAPIGWGHAKGAVDLESCRDVDMTGCQLSALGDTMHIRRSENVVFSGNQILGSRMGAFFIAEFCKNVTIQGNTVDGTNGSRVMSVEKSTEDITIVGNTFRNGGRGSWINQPKNFIMTGNVFVDNTTKGEKDPRRGRRDFYTGLWQSYPEVYLTLYRPDGSYGPAIISDNIFHVADSCFENVMAFDPNGCDIVVRNNVFLGEERKIFVAPGCQEVDIRDNKGVTVKIAE